MLAKHTLYLFLVTFGLLLSSTCVCAQEVAPDNVEAEGPIIEAATRFKPRPKFLVYETELLRDFTVIPTSVVVGDAQANVSQNLIREGKLKFPMVLKERTKIIGGLGYRHEQFKFSEQSDDVYPLFTRFDDKSLKRISFSAYMQQILKDKKFVYIYFNSSLNSDRPGSENINYQLKWSVVGIYGKQRGPHKQLGFGASFGYDFGQPAAYPVLMFNNDFSLHWGYELLLPKSAKLRYSPNLSNHFIGALELQGASYSLQDSLFSGFDLLEFRRSSVRALLTYERELHDWLWFGVTAGYRFPINLFISEPGDRRADALMKIDADPTPYLSFSIFLVPPNKMYNRAKGSG
uniref:hypothetical protein n=1 Tax=Fulvivirga sp. TaxID=1931237 RepID=UPI0040494859